MDEEGSSSVHSDDVDGFLRAHGLDTSHVSAASTGNDHRGEPQDASDAQGAGTEEERGMHVHEDVLRVNTGRPMWTSDSSDDDEPPGTRTHHAPAHHQSGALAPGGPGVESPAHRSEANEPEHDEPVSPSLTDNAEVIEEIAGIHALEHHVREYNQSIQTQLQSNPFRAGGAAMPSAVVHASTGRVPDSDDEEDREFDPPSRDAPAFDQSHISMNLSDSLSLEASGDDEWTRINHTLTSCGFDEVELEFEVGGDGHQTSVCTNSSAKRVITEVLRKYRERGRRIEALAHNPALTESTRSASSKHEEAITSLRRQNERLKTQLANVREELQDAREEKLAKGRTSTHEERKLRGMVKSLQTQLRHSEQRVRAKEIMTDRLTEKLRTHMETEKLAQRRARDVLSKHLGRAPRSGREVDSRMVELVSAFQRRDEELVQEVSSLQTEVRDLNDSLREKENSLLRHTEASFSFSMDDDTEGVPPATVVGSAGTSPVHKVVQNITDKYRDQARQVEVLQRRETQYTKQLRHHKQTIEELRQTIADMEADRENAQAELGSRPTVNAWKRAQAEMKELERELAQERHRTQEAKDLSALRKMMSTQALVRIDKENFRLRLHRIDDLSKQVMREVLQGTCRALSVSDVSTIVPCIEKLTRAIGVVPRLKQFTERVCDLVFGTNPGSRGKYVMEDALPAIAQWKANTVSEISTEKLRMKLQVMLHTRVTQTASRADGTATHATSPPTTTAVTREVLAKYDDRAIIDTVKRLMALELETFQRREYFEKAQGCVENEPNVFVNQVVAHFQQLFDVADIEGVFPRMNDIFVALNEMRTTLNALKQTCGLNPAAPPALLLNTVMELVKEVEDAGGGTLGALITTGVENAEGAQRGGGSSLMPVHVDQGNGTGGQQLGNEVVVLENVLAVDRSEDPNPATSIVDEGAGVTDDLRGSFDL